MRSNFTLTNGIVDVARDPAAVDESDEQRLRRMLAPHCTPVALELTIAKWRVDQQIVLFFTTVPTITPEELHHWNCKCPTHAPYAGPKPKPE